MASFLSEVFQYVPPRATDKVASAEMHQSMIVTDIYKHYRIPPNLQRHMLEVTVVGEYVLDHWSGPNVDRQKILTALLFHDMGNIVKFKQPFLGEIGETPEIAAYWRNVQEQFRHRYGHSSHAATEAIVAELGIDPGVQALIAVTSYDVIEAGGYQSWESRIADYADMCVAPQGIVGFIARMADLRNRYAVTIDGLGIQLREENAQLVEKCIAGGVADLYNVDCKTRIAYWEAYDVSVTLPRTDK